MHKISTCMPVTCWKSSESIPQDQDQALLISTTHWSSASSLGTCMQPNLKTWMGLGCSMWAGTDGKTTTILIRQYQLWHNRGMWLFAHEKSNSPAFHTCDICVIHFSFTWLIVHSYSSDTWCSTEICLMSTIFHEQNEVAGNCARTSMLQVMTRSWCSPIFPVKIRQNSLVRKIKHKWSGAANAY